MRYLICVRNSKVCLCVLPLCATYGVYVSLLVCATYGVCNLTNGCNLRWVCVIWLACACVCSLYNCVQLMTCVYVRACYFTCLFNWCGMCALYLFMQLVYRVILRACATYVTYVCVCICRVMCKSIYACHFHDRVWYSVRCGQLLNVKLFSECFMKT